MHVLNAPFIVKEIKKAVFNMEPLKALRSDRFSMILFQKNWDVVGPLIVDACMNFLNMGKLLNEINKTFIVLIPTTKCSKKVSYYRLSNFIF